MLIKWVSAVDKVGTNHGRGERGEGGGGRGGEEEEKEEEEM